MSGEDATTDMTKIAIVIVASGKNGGFVRVR